MSTSFLYHSFGIRGYDYCRTSYEQGTTIFMIEQKRERLRCSRCGSADVQRRGEVLRRYQHLSVGPKPVFIELAVARVACPHCDVIRQVQVPFAEPQRTYTRAFARHVLELRSGMTIQDVARLLGVSGWMVRDIEKRHLEKHYARPKLKQTTRIAIDEISIGTGHRYLTVVMDLQSRRVLHVGPGKGADALKPFWRRLKSAHAWIDAVAIDMSPAYIQAVSDNLPLATLVFDRFHLVKLFNARLSNFRRELYREAIDGLHKNVLKGTRWLLLKNSEHLDEKRNEHQRLNEALQLNEPLATAYYLKEDLRQLWEQSTQGAAERFLNDWCSRARASGIRFLQTFAKTLQGHRNGILAWYDAPISTGPLEGLNNKIKTLQRQAYGFRDQDFFRLKIYALHKTRNVLIG
jgi:transposase